VILGFTLTWFFVQPAPPRNISIATGPKDGAYYKFGMLYADFLRRQGIQLELISTAGTPENYQVLLENNGVDLAIVQGGAMPSNLHAADTIESLASLYFEPVWVFHRADLSISDLRDLGQLRIAIGIENSGTAAVAQLLLKENGIESSAETELLPLGGRQAAQALKEGRIDAAIFVMSPRSDLIQELAATDNIRLLSLQRHEAYARRHPFLTSVTLERGVIDLQNDLPRRNVEMIAPVANLVANKSLNDALIPLLMRAATEIHQTQASLLQRGRLPSTEFIEFPLNSSAKRYFEQGPPFLQKYLPFWIASAFDRGKILLLPALTLLLPLFRIAPPLYRWSIRSRIFRWYEVLRGIEADLRDQAQANKLTKHASTLSEMEGELDELQTVPLAYMEEFYNLRLHVEFVERRVHRALESAKIPSAEEQSQESN
jgi:TRAP transporter TAXI family solute receptor